MDSSLLPWPDPARRGNLATHGPVSAATQRQAMNAIVFLYRHVLDQPIADRIEPVRARRHTRLPVIMTQEEVQQVLNEIKGTHLLMARLLYGCGLRLMECIRLHEEDLQQGHGEVFLPAALARKYGGAGKEFRWQCVFPARALSTDPRTGLVRRHHVLESGLQQAVKVAVDRAGITKRVFCHTFRR